MIRKCSWPLIVICSLALLTLAVVGEGRLWGQRADLQSMSTAASDSFLFILELNGQHIDSYSECSGLGSSNDIEEETGLTDAGVFVRQKLPGTLQWHNITLKRTGPGSINVWLWRKAMEDVEVEAAIRNGSIVMLRSGTSQEYARWNFRNGWAARLSFDGSVEELTIVHEGLERVGAVPPMPPPPRR